MPLRFITAYRAARVVEEAVRVAMLLSGVLSVLLVASSSFGQTPPSSSFPPVPPPPPPPDEAPPEPPPPTPPQPEPTPQPPAQPPPQPGQWQQQPGYYPQQQPGYYPQQQPGQYPPQPGQWQQQPGYYPQQQPGQWQPGPGQWERREPEPKVFASSLGFKFFAGADLWTTPGNIEPGYDALGFAGSAGGFGWGTALYYEARIAQYFGLELDFGYDHSGLHRDLTYKINNVPFNVTESVTASGLRWGLLAKGIIPVTFGRVWFGLGPEFVSGSSTSGTVEVTSGNPTDQQKKNLENSISTSSKHSTMLTLGFGLAVEIGDYVEIPFDLRAAKNFSQDSDWKDRVDTTKVFDPTPRYDVTVQSSWDFRLGTGIAVRF